MLWNTLSLAIPDLVAFALLFLTVFIGYTLLGLIAFGPNVRSFHNFMTSLWTCYGYLVGGGNEQELVYVQPTVATIFYITFILFVVLILINMFIAIISQYYALEKENTEKRSKKKDNSDYTVEFDLYKQLKRFFKGLRPKLQITVAGDELDEYQQTMYLQKGNTVIVMDCDYIQAERARLRKLFQGATHVIMICSRFWKMAGGSKFDFIEGIKYVPPQVTPQKFQILYLQSVSINALNLLQSVKKGGKIVLNDESFSSDKVILECIDTPPLFFQYHYYIGSGYHVKKYKIVQGGSVFHNQEVRFPFYTYILQMYYAILTFFKTSYQNYLDQKYVHLDWKSFLLLGQEEIREVLIKLLKMGKTKVRFDELIKHIRIVAAKKLIRMGVENLNERVDLIVASLMFKHFPQLSEITKAEAGKQYVHIYYILLFTYIIVIFLIQ